MTAGSFLAAGDESMKNFFKSRAAGFIAAGLALILIVAGILFEQHAQVLAKAVRICLECIGIG